LLKMRVARVLTLLTQHTLFYFCVEIFAARFC
jgi:hypothetical protein